MKTKHVKSTVEGRPGVPQTKVKTSANKQRRDYCDTNEAQLMLLQLFDSQSLTDKQLGTLKKTILRFLVEDMNAEAEQVLHPKQTIAKSLFDQDSSQSRTERLTQLRSHSE